jgi:protoporphyrinogen oxidase
MNRVQTIILGGGLSGLSCAYHLEANYLLIEQGDQLGGLARSVRQDGFTFDYTGHLLHLHHPYTRQLIPQLLKDNLLLLERRAWIYSHQGYTRYPYQANLYGLPKSVIEECLSGLVSAQLENRTYQGESPESFESWVFRTFGRGFAKHFFFPYNEKLWCVPRNVLTADWVAPFVPKPSIQEVINGAFTDQTKKFGYNASFYYPKEGGIQSLVTALAQKLQEVRLNTRVTAIDLSKKEVTFESGEKVSYTFLVSSLPLAEFLQIAQPLPSEIESFGSQLRWSSVYNINLGLRTASPAEKTWVYFPEKKYRFYRVGFPSNFSAAVAPPGHGSMYIEMAHRPGQGPTEAEAVEDALQGLEDCGLLKDRADIVTCKILPIPVAYVTYDRNRPRAVQSLLDYLDSQRVYSIGRYGGWKYSYMEEALLDGLATAEKILGQ